MLAFVFAMFLGKDARACFMHAYASLWTCVCMFRCMQVLT